MSKYAGAYAPRKIQIANSTRRGVWAIFWVILIFGIVALLKML
jgi:hypothetical protein